jgi:hypothetical protein
VVEEITGGLEAEHVEDAEKIVIGVVKGNYLVDLR